MKPLRPVDAELAEHLKHAEDHLIEAVKLFARKTKPDRDLGYYKRLLVSQETVTTLYRQELIRIRGPLRPPKRGRRR